MPFISPSLKLQPLTNHSNHISNINTMSKDYQERFIAKAESIRLLLQSRSRPVVTGCVFKIPFSFYYSGDILENNIEYLYGIVGSACDYCEVSTARGYDVSFCLDGVNIPNSLLPILYHPLYDNDMVILRYPEQPLSLDDHNIDRLFKKENGKWVIRNTAFNAK